MPTPGTPPFYPSYPPHPRSATYPPPPPPSHSVQVHPGSIRSFPIYAQNPNDNTNKRTENARKSSSVNNCTCRKSRCLKLYCQCFSGSRTCGPSCRCTDCHNTSEHADAIAAARRGISGRNSKAFDTTKHHIKCKCKRSYCLKKYCECFQKGLLCGEACMCDNCLNTGQHSAMHSQRQVVATVNETNLPSRRVSAVPCAPVASPRMAVAAQLPQQLQQHRFPKTTTTTTKTEQQTQANNDKKPVVTPEKVPSPQVAPRSAPSGLDMIAALAMAELQSGAGLESSSRAPKDAMENTHSEEGSPSDSKEKEHGPSIKKKSASLPSKPASSQDSAEGAVPILPKPVAVPSAATATAAAPFPPPNMVRSMPQHPPPHYENPYFYNGVSPYGRPPPPPPPPPQSYGHYPMPPPVASPPHPVRRAGLFPAASTTAKKEGEPKQGELENRKRTFDEEKKEDEDASVTIGADATVVVAKKAKVESSSEKEEVQQEATTDTKDSNVGSKEVGQSDSTAKSMEVQPQRPAHPTPPPQMSPPHNHFYAHVPPPPHYSYPPPPGYGYPPPVVRSFPPIASPPSAAMHHYPHRHSPSAGYHAAATPHYPSPPAQAAAAAAATRSSPVQVTPPPGLQQHSTPHSAPQQYNFQYRRESPPPPPAATVTTAEPQKQRPLPSQSPPPVLYKDVMLQASLPKLLSFRKVCSNCGRLRVDHKKGFGNQCTFLDCGRCGAGRETHKLAKKSMGVLCKLTPEEGADPEKTQAYDNKIAELSSVLQEEAQKARREASRRKRMIPVCEKCGAGRETHKLAGRSMGRACGLTIGEGASPRCLQNYYKGRRELAARNKAAKTSKTDVLHSNVLDDEAAEKCHV